MTRYDEWAPCLVAYTSAATHDIKMLKGLHFLEGSFLAVDRAYIEYSELERLTLEKVCYVTKRKKDLVYETLSISILVTPDGKTEMVASTVRFCKGDVRHTARIIEFCRTTADTPHC